jgi:hypothetical protein
VHIYAPHDIHTHGLLNLISDYRAASSLVLIGNQIDYKRSEFRRLCGLRRAEHPVMRRLGRFRRTPASRVLWCRGPGRAGSAAFVHDGVLRSRQRCLTNSSAWSGGSFGKRPAPTMVRMRKRMIAHGRAEIDCGQTGRAPYDRTHAEL